VRACVCAALAAVALACDLGVGEGPSGICAAAGEQCALPDGPLGVCERTQCELGGEPPCFACTPQH
jgi:hypothetical protein